MKNYAGMLIGLLLFALTAASCEKIDLKKEVPGCIEKKIRKIKKADVARPPIQVWEWQVDGNTYYYITAACCDQFNYLYDNNCNEVCAPDGGFSGAGDGNCPVFDGPIEKTLVWEGDRE